MNIDIRKITTGTLVIAALAGVGPVAGAAARGGGGGGGGNHVLPVPAQPQPPANQPQIQPTQPAQPAQPAQAVQAKVIRLLRNCNRSLLPLAKGKLTLETLAAGGTLTTAEIDGVPPGSVVSAVVGATTLGSLPAADVTRHARAVFPDTGLTPATVKSAVIRLVDAAGTAIVASNC